MTHECTVIYDGQVHRPEASLDLPSNSRYQVVLTPLPPAGASPEKPRTVWETLAEHTGSVDGPEDWSRQLDHYLYDTPKPGGGNPFGPVSWERQRPGSPTITRS